MPDTTTTNYGWTKPQVGGSNDTWGDKLNADLESIDTQIKTVSDAVAALAGALVPATFSNSSVLAKNSAAALAPVVMAEGTILARAVAGEIAAMDYATLKAALVLNNVENYSRAQLKTYFDTLYSPAGGGGGGLVGEPHTDILTEISSEGIAANQIWVGDGANSLTKKAISVFMQAALAATDAAAFQVATGVAVSAGASLANPGYAKFTVDGEQFIIQWGQLAMASNSRPTINFPTAYSAFSVVVGNGGVDRFDRPDNARVVSTGTANFTVCNDADWPILFNWIAIGK